MEKIIITTPFIRLDAALKLAGGVETGGHAKIVIQAGQVEVNGQPCPMRGKKLVPGDSFSFEGKSYEVCSGEG